MNRPKDEGGGDSSQVRSVIYKQLHCFDYTFNERLEELITFNN